MEIKQQTARAFEALSEVAKALGNPSRLRLLEILRNGPRTVEELAATASLPLASASQHLQVLRRSTLVRSEREGRRIRYTLEPEAEALLTHLQRVAKSTHPGLRDALSGLHPEAGLDREATEAALDGGAVLLDLRPTIEFAHGSAQGAISVPMAELASRMAELPQNRLIIAMCRGVWCAEADEAVALLRASGRRAERCTLGGADWI